MKRRLLLFLAVLLIMLAIKYAFSQSEDTSSDWNEPIIVCGGYTGSEFAAFLLSGPALGICMALARMLLWRSPRPLLEPLRLN
jgi:hypothetical protein